MATNPKPNTPLIPTSRTSDDLSRIDRLLEKTARYYPHQALPKESFDEWRASWVKLAKRYGIARLEAGVMEARDQSAFFPLPHAIEDHIPAAEVIAVNVKDEDCVYCAGTGWKDAAGRTCAEVIGKGPVRMERCSCVKREFVKVGK